MGILLTDEEIQCALGRFGCSKESILWELTEAIAKAQLKKIYDTREPMWIQVNERRYFFVDEQALQKEHEE